MSFQEELEKLIFQYYADSIYLAGSFTGDLRDEIVKANPGLRFADPRDNPQSSMLWSNINDVAAAMGSPATIALFPFGKSYGVMTFVELGIAWSTGSRIIVLDQSTPGSQADAATKTFLSRIATHHFEDSKGLAEFLRGYNAQPKAPHHFQESLGTLTSIYMAGDLEKVFEATRAHRPDLRLYDNPREGYKLLEEGCVDLMVMELPVDNNALDRITAFGLGVALTRKIPVVALTRPNIPYPPLIGGLFRRDFRAQEPLEEYLRLLEDQRIDYEAKIMYGLFKEFNK